MGCKDIKVRELKMFSNGSVFFKWSFDKIGLGTSVVERRDSTPFRALSRLQNCNNSTLRVGGRPPGVLIPAMFHTK